MHAWHTLSTHTRRKCAAITARNTRRWTLFKLMHVAPLGLVRVSVISPSPSTRISIDAAAEKDGCATRGCAAAAEEDGCATRGCVAAAEKDG